MTDFENLFAHFANRKILFLITLALAYFAFNGPAHADTADSYFNITCFPELNYFSIVSLHIEDSDKRAEKKGDASSKFVLYSSLSEKPYECELKNHRVKVVVEYFSPQTAEPYHADHGFYTIYWDAEKIGQFSVGSFAPNEIYTSLYSMNNYNTADKEVFIGKTCNLSTGKCTKLNLENKTK